MTRPPKQPGHFYVCPECHEPRSTQSRKGKPVRCKICIDNEFKGITTKRRARRMKRDEKARAAWARIQERTDKRGRDREERLARRRRNRKRWLIMRQDSPEVIARVIARREASRIARLERESIIGQPDSPYEIAVAIVEAETQVSRKEWEYVLKHPNNVRVNEIALELVEQRQSSNSSTTSTERAA